MFKVGLRGACASRDAKSSFSASPNQDHCLGLSRQLKNSVFLFVITKLRSSEWRSSKRVDTGMLIERTGLYAKSYIEI